MKDKNKVLSKGFTLMEVMIVIATLSVMAGLAIPSYTNAIEQSRAKEAEANLKTICLAEKIYKINNGSYWASGAPAITVAGSTTCAASPNDINACLNIDLSTPQYYSITSITTGGGGTTFTAQATRNGGSWNGRVASINQTGAYTAP